MEISVSDLVRHTEVGQIEGELMYWEHQHCNKSSIGVLYEDEDIIATDKWEGIASHSGGGGVFPLGLVEHLRSCERNAGTQLAHRLDKYTSGVLMSAKNKSALLDLQKQLALGCVSKRYYSLVNGSWPKQWDVRQVINVPMTKGLDGVAGLIAVNKKGYRSSTIVSCVKKWRGFVLLAMIPQTGRSHQLRVHCKHIGLPIVGDKKYGRPGSYSGRMMLHSASLSLLHPHKPRRLTFFTPLPLLFRGFTDDLEPRVPKEHHTTLSF